MHRRNLVIRWTARGCSSTPTRRTEGRSSSHRSSWRLTAAARRVPMRWPMEGLSTRPSVGGGLGSGGLGWSPLVREAADESAPRAGGRRSRERRDGFPRRACGCARRDSFEYLPQAWVGEDSGCYWSMCGLGELGQLGQSALAQRRKRRSVGDVRGDIGPWRRPCAAVPWPDRLPTMPSGS